jgi:hypothetical protein
VREWVRLRIIPNGAFIKASLSLFSGPRRLLSTTRNAQKFSNGITEREKEGEKIKVESLT